MKSNEKMIQFDNVTATYENGAGIFNVELEISKSEMIFLMGPTGSGKSTLLKTIYKEFKINMKVYFTRITNLSEKPFVF